MAVQGATGGVSASGVTSTTISLTLAASSSAIRGRCVVALLSQRNTGTDLGDPICSGVTYGGQDMLKVAESAYSSGMDKAIAYVFRDPPDGASDVVATFTGTSHTGFFIVAEFQQVNIDNPVGDTDARTGTTSSSTTSLVTATIGIQTYDDDADPGHVSPIDHKDLCIDVIALHGPSASTMTMSSGQTALVGGLPAKNTDNQWAGASWKSPAGLPDDSNVTFGYSVTLSSGMTWAALGLVIKDEENNIPGYIPAGPIATNDAMIGGQI